MSFRRAQEMLTTDRLQVRRYEPGDKRAVRRLHDDALNEVGAHLGSGPWDDDLHEIENVYLDADGGFLVGVLEREAGRGSVGPFDCIYYEREILG